MKKINNIFVFLFLLSSCTWNEIEVECIPDQEVFLASIKPIINNHCVECHNFENPLGGVTLDSNNISNSYNNIINAINNNSLRYEVVSRKMPPPWSTPMTDDEINTIKNWIDCD